MGFTQEDGKGKATWSAPTMTAAQQAETDRLIQLDKDRHNFGGTGINGDIANLGLAAATGVEPQYSGMGGNIGGMGGGSPPSRPTPVGGPTYRADVPVTAGVVSQPQSIVNDIGALGINAGLSGVDPVGDSFYSGRPSYSGEGVSNSIIDTTLKTLGGVSTNNWTGIDPSVQDIAEDPGAYGGPVTRAKPHVDFPTAIGPEVSPEQPKRTGQVSNLWSYGMLGSKLPPSLQTQSQGTYVPPTVVEKVKHDTHYSGTPQAGRSSFSVSGLDDPSFLGVAALEQGKPGFSESSVEEQRLKREEKKLAKAIAKATIEPKRTTYRSSALLGGYDAFY
jgi:hypothetical protein